MSYFNANCPQQAEKLLINKIQNKSSDNQQKSSQKNNDHFFIEKVEVQASKLNQQLKIYEWRNTVESRIVKCQWICILPLTTSKLIVQTKRKHFPFKLNNIGKISLSQILFILRQILKGFQILFNKFGSFKITEEQVHCWLSKQLNKNSFQSICITQHQFLMQILYLLSNHEIKSNLGYQFNNKLKNTKEINFKNLNYLIQEFIKQKNLKITNQNTFKQKFSSPINFRSSFNTEQKELSKVSSFSSIRYSDKQVLKQQGLGQLSQVSSPMKSLLNRKSIKRQTINNPYSAKTVNRIEFSKKNPQSAKLIKEIDQQTQISQKQASLQKINQFKKIIKSNIQLRSNIVDKKIFNKNYKSQVNQQNAIRYQSNKICLKGIITREDPIFLKQQNSLKEKIQFISIKDCPIFQVSKTLEDFCPKDLNISIQLSSNMSNMKKQQNYEDKIQQLFCVEYKNQNNISTFNKAINIDNQKDIFKFQLKTFQSFEDPQSLINGADYDLKCLQNALNLQNTNQKLPSYENQQNDLFKNHVFAQFKNQLIKRNHQEGHSSFKKVAFFQSLDSIAQEKQMNSSIVIGKQIRKRQSSPVRLQKLGKFKLNTFQSIIQEDKTEQKIHNQYKFTQSFIF